MSCDTVRNRLDALTDGTMPSSERESIARHLEGCSSCRADFEALNRVRAELPGLPSLEASSPDVERMWAAIRPRLSGRRRGWAGRPLAMPAWALAAAAALLVAVSAGVTMLLTRSAAPTASSARLDVLEADYQSATAELTRLLDVARRDLAPETVASLERNLTAIDSALSEVRRALAADPGNLTLEQLVLSAWRQKVDLLRRATAGGTET